MTPEQNERFMAALQKLMLTSSEGVERDGKVEKLRDSELRSGLMFLWLAREANGYLNLTHSEAQSICDTDKNSTLRAYLIRLRNTGVLSDYSTNGTVRLKFSGYPGRELITHRKEQQVLPDITNSRCGVTPDEESSETRDGASRVCYPTSRDRAVASLLRDAPSRVSRNFDDYPQNLPSMLVSKLDTTNTDDSGTNLLTATAATAIDPVEEALSVALMAAAGMWMKTAKQLATQYPFEVIRKAVAFWWCNRKSRGGEFAESPGIVLTWLRNPDTVALPKLSQEFMASDLYMNHRTKNEIEADAKDAELQALPDHGDTAEPEGYNDAWPDESDTWNNVLSLLESELPTSTYKTWLTSTAAVIDEQSLTCTVCCGNATTRDWLANRLSQMISRTVNAVAQQRYRVQFEVRRRS